MHRLACAVRGSRVSLLPTQTTNKKVTLLVRCVKHIKGALSLVDDVVESKGLPRLGDSIFTTPSSKRHASSSLHPDRSMQSPHPQQQRPPPKTRDLEQKKHLYVSIRKAHRTQGGHTDSSISCRCRRTAGRKDAREQREEKTKRLKTSTRKACTHT